MKVYERYLIDQAKALRIPPRIPEGLERYLLAMPCGFRVKDVCRSVGARLEFGKGYIPGTACYPCHAYIGRCLEKDIKADEVYFRIQAACLKNWEVLWKNGRLTIELPD